jgi:hypothetical protein
MTPETQWDGTPYQKTTPKIKVPIMIQDPLTSRYDGMQTIQHIYIEDEEYFLDGPITRRVAVLDFDPYTGQLNPGVKFFHPPNRKVGYYYMRPPRSADDYDKYDIYQPEFIALSVFGTAYRVLELIEKNDTLGRKLRWGFEAPQLLIVPRAGEYPNAFYDPVSHSLQFFFVQSPDDPNQKVYAALSRDIVAHETGHAVLDGIVPFLRHGISTESRALHETIADMTALLMALNSGYLTKTVLDHTRGSIERPTAFSAIADQFAEALGREHALRDLCNDKTRGELGPRPSAYALSEMLSGALYAVIMQMHEYEKPIRAKKKRYASKPDPIFSASGEALAVVGESIKNMIFRALDYLPPGDISFADFGRALLLANRQGTPLEKRGRDWLVAEFVKRGTVSSAAELTAVDAEITFSALQAIDLEQLQSSDWVAYKFANEHRDFLGIPDDISFQVHPRLVADHKRYRTSGRELLFKVSWAAEEQHTFGPLLVFFGTTLMIDWETKQIVGLLTTDRTDAQHQARSDTIAYVKESGLLQLGAAAFRPDGKLKANAIQGEMVHGTLRVRDTVRLMHITEEGA